MDFRRAWEKFQQSWVCWKELPHLTCLHPRKHSKETMKGVPEEEEDAEGEVWSSLTTPPPKIPIPCQKHALDIALQEEEEEEEGEDYWDPEDLDGIPEPPDGGWGWVIVAASFLCNTVVDGIAYSFGIFLIHFVNYYGSPKGKTAWIGSLLSGCYLSAGPIVSALTNKFGCRPVTMAGSLLSCAAFLLSTIAPNVDVLMFTYGIMGGIGFGLIYLPAIVSVGYYFSTKRAFATGIAVCGSGMGAFIFAPVTQYLLDLYDWKGALIILAGLSLNCMVFGALMRPLEAKKISHKVSKIPIQINLPSGSMDKTDSGLVLASDEQNVQSSVLNTEPGVQSTLNINEVARKLSELPTLPPLPSEEMHNSVDVVPAVGVIVTRDASLQPIHPSITTSGKSTEGFQKTSLGTLGQEKLSVPPNGAIKMYLSLGDRKEQRRFTMPAMPVSENVLCPTANNNYLIQRRSTGRGSSWTSHGGPPRRRRVSNKRDLARPLYRKDIFYSGSIAHLPEFRHSRNDVRSYVASVTSIPRSESPMPEPEEKTKCCSLDCKLPKSMGDTLKEVLDFSLLKESPFLLACVANVFGMMGFYIPFVYVADSSIEKGISEERSAFLLSIIGITNLIGRLVFGWVVDRPRVRALDVNNICLTLSGIGTLIVPFCLNYAAIVSACCIFSFFVSAYISLTSIILVDMLGLDKLTNSFGLLSLFRGAASIVGPPLAGTVYDMTGSYDIPFFIAGALLIMSAVLTFFVPCLIRRSQKQMQTDNILHPKEISVASDTDSGRPESITVTEVVTAL